MHCSIGGRSRLGLEKRLARRRSVSKRRSALASWPSRRRVARRRRRRRGVFRRARRPSERSARKRKNDSACKRSRSSARRKWRRRPGRPRTSAVSTASPSGRRREPHGERRTPRSPRSRSFAHVGMATRLRRRRPGQLPKKRQPALAGGRALRRGGIGRHPAIDGSSTGWAKIGRWALATKKSHATAAIAGRRGATARLLPAMDLVRRASSKPCGLPPSRTATAHRHPALCSFTSSGVTAAGTGGGDDRWSRGPREGPRDFGDRGPPRRGFEERGPPREGGDDRWSRGPREGARDLGDRGPPRRAFDDRGPPRREGGGTEGQGGGSSWRRA